MSNGALYYHNYKACEPEDLAKTLEELKKPSARFFPLGGNALVIYDDVVNRKSRGSCLIEGMSSQCGMMFIHNINVYSQFAKELYDAVTEVARDLNYSAVQATMPVYTDLHAVKLSENGFAKVFEWDNRRSGATNGVFIKPIEGEVEIDVEDEEEDEDSF